MSVTVEMRTHRVVAKLRRATPLMKAHLAKRLNYWGNRIISDIRQNPTLFTHETGRLKNSLWTKRLRGSLVQKMGWGVPYGSVLEFGPRKKAWIIRPKRAKALRFRVGGRWAYAKWVKHVDRPTSRRRHFGPAMKKYDGRILRDLAKVPDRVLSGDLK